MPFDFELVPSGEAIFPNYLYASDGVYLCRNIHAIRAYKFEGETQNGDASVSSIRNSPIDKPTLKYRKKFDTTLKQLGEPLDMWTVASDSDKRREERIVEENTRKPRPKISEMVHLRGEYNGDDEVLAHLDTLQVRMVEVSKLVERIGEKVLNCFFTLKFLCS